MESNIISLNTIQAQQFTKVAKFFINLKPQQFSLLLCRIPFYKFFMACSAYLSLYTKIFQNKGIAPFKDNQHNCINAMNKIQRKSQIQAKLMHIARVGIQKVQRNYTIQTIKSILNLLQLVNYKYYDQIRVASNVMIEILNDQQIYQTKVLDKGQFLQEHSKQVLQMSQLNQKQFIVGCNLEMDKKQYFKYYDCLVQMFQRKIKIIQQKSLKFFKIKVQIQKKIQQSNLKDNSLQQKVQIQRQKMALLALTNQRLQLGHSLQVQISQIQSKVITQPQSNQLAIQPEIVQEMEEILQKGQIIQQQKQIPLSLYIDKQYYNYENDLRNKNWNYFHQRLKDAFSNDNLYNTQIIIINNFYYGVNFQNGWFYSKDIIQIKNNQRLFISLIQQKQEIDQNTRQQLKTLFSTTNLNMNKLGALLNKKSNFIKQNIQKIHQNIKKSLNRQKKLHNQILNIANKSQLKQMKIQILQSQNQLLTSLATKKQLNQALSKIQSGINSFIQKQNKFNTFEKSLQIVASKIKQYSNEQQYVIQISKSLQLNTKQTAQLILNVEGLTKSNLQLQKQIKRTIQPLSNGINRTNKSLTILSLLVTNTFKKQQQRYHKNNLILQYIQQNVGKIAKNQEEATKSLKSVETKLLNMGQQNKKIFDTINKQIKTHLTEQINKQNVKLNESIDIRQKAIATKYLQDLKSAYDNSQTIIRDVNSASTKKIINHIQDVINKSVNKMKISDQVYDISLDNYNKLQQIDYYQQQGQTQLMRALDLSVQQLKNVSKSSKKQLVNLIQNRSNQVRNYVKQKIDKSINSSGDKQALVLKKQVRSLGVFLANLRASIKQDSSVNKGVLQQILGYLNNIDGQIIKYFRLLQQVQNNIFDNMNMTEQIFDNNKLILKTVEALGQSNNSLSQNLNIFYHDWSKSNGEQKLLLNSIMQSQSRNTQIIVNNISNNQRKIQQQFSNIRTNLNNVQSSIVNSTNLINNNINNNSSNIYNAVQNSGSYVSSQIQGAAMTLSNQMNNNLNMMANQNNTNSSILSNQIGLQTNFINNNINNTQTQIQQVANQISNNQNMNYNYIQKNINSMGSHLAQQLNYNNQFIVRSSNQLRQGIDKLRTKSNQQSIFIANNLFKTQQLNIEMQNNNQKAISQVKQLVSQLKQKVKDQSNKLQKKNQNIEQQNLILRMKLQRFKQYINTFYQQSFASHQVAQMIQFLKNKKVETTSLLNSNKQFQVFVRELLDQDNVNIIFQKDIALKQLKSYIKGIISDNNNFKKVLKSKQQDLTILQDRVQTLQIQIKSLKFKISKSYDQQAVKRQVIAQKQSQIIKIAKLVNQNQSLKKLFEQKNEQYNSSLAKIKQLQNKINQIKSQKETFDQFKLNYQKFNRQLANERQLVKKIRKNKQQIQAALEKKKGLNQRLQTMNKTLQQQVQSYQYKLKQSKSSQVKARVQLGNLQQQFQNYQGASKIQFNNLKGNYNSLLMTKVDIQDRHEKLGHKYMKLISKNNQVGKTEVQINADHQLQRNQLNGQIETHKRINLDLKNKLQIQQQRCQILSLQNASLTKKYQNIYKELLDNLNNQSGKNSKVKSQLINLELQNSRLNKQIQAMKDSQENLSKKLTNQHKVKLQQNNTIISKLKSQLIDSKKQLNRVQQQLKDVSKELTQQINKSNTIKAYINQTENNIYLIQQLLIKHKRNSNKKRFNLMSERNVLLQYKILIQQMLVQLEALNQQKTKQDTNKANYKRYQQQITVKQERLKKAIQKFNKLQTQIQVKQISLTNLNKTIQDQEKKVQQLDIQKKKRIVKLQKQIQQQKIRLKDIINNQKVDISIYQATVKQRQSLKRSVQQSLTTIQQLKALIDQKGGNYQNIKKHAEHVTGQLQKKKLLQVQIQNLKKQVVKQQQNLSNIIQTNQKNLQSINQMVQRQSKYITSINRLTTMLKKNKQLRISYSQLAQIVQTQIAKTQSLFSQLQQKYFSSQNPTQQQKQAYQQLASVYRTKINGLNMVFQQTTKQLTNFQQNNKRQKSTFIQESQRTIYQPDPQISFNNVQSTDEFYQQNVSSANLLNQLKETQSILQNVQKSVHYDNGHFIGTQKGPLQSFTIFLLEAVLQLFQLVKQLFSNIQNDILPQWKDLKQNKSISPKDQKIAQGMFDLFNSYLIIIQQTFDSLKSRQFNKTFWNLYPQTKTIPAKIKSVYDLIYE